jgi:plasmid stabilization system protein ParE
MSDYILGSEVERDLDIIWEYIANHSVDAADRWIAKLFFEDHSTLADFPLPIKVDE